MVTYDQLNALLPEAANDPEQLDGILEALEAKGVELVEDLGETTDAPEAAEEGAEAAGGEEEQVGTGIYEGAQVTDDDIAEKIEPLWDVERVEVEFTG